MFLHGGGAREGIPDPNPDTLSSSRRRDFPEAKARVSTPLDLEWAAKRAGLATSLAQVLSQSSEEQSDHSSAFDPARRGEKAREKARGSEKRGARQGELFWDYEECKPESLASRRPTRAQVSFSRSLALDISLALAL
jgi:hypothetical protein